MKKALVVFFGLLLVAMPVALQAQFNCITNPDNSLTITNYTGANTVVVIPTNYLGLTVTGIGAQAFDGDSNITGITIASTVANIGDDAFAGCSSLTGMTIPAGVTNIGAGIFDACASLTAITVAGGNSFYSSSNGVLFDKNQLALIEYPGGQSGSYAVPASVTSIDGEAFFACNGLTNISVSVGVTNIGPSAFELCTNLTAFVIPSNVTVIQAETFFDCTALTNVVISDSVTNIAGSAFYGCSKLANVVIPGSVTSIGESAFDGCRDLTAVMIPDSVINIADAAFYGCASLTNIVIPSSVTSIGAQVFALCASLPQVVIPASVTNIGFGAFYDATNLTSVVIPNSVSNVGDYAFDQCSGLTNIVIPGSVTNIGDYAFQSCSNLASVSFTGNAPTADLTVFMADTNLTIYYTPGTTGWTSGFAGLATTAILSGSLQVTITPTTAALAGAQWQVDAGTLQSSGATVTGLTVGTHTVSFSAVSNFIAPPSQTILITNALVTTATGFYAPETTSSNGLILITNGFGAIQHAAWPAHLVIGKKYTLTAAPASKNVFTYWFGGTNQPYGILGSSSRYTFAMQSNLVIEANFVTNSFLAAAGAYHGLFAPDTSVRQQTNSGSFLLNVTSSGTVSGNLDLGGQTVPFSGKFNSSGTADLISIRSHGESSLTTILQMNFTNQSVAGTVSDGSFTAVVDGDRDVFTATDKATQFEGQYTFIIPGTNDSAVGPFGVSYGTAKVSATGTITMAGSLADGTSISQSSQVSKNGRWPLYVSLYDGRGSLWGWNYFTNQTLAAVPGLSWINATNVAKTAVYRSGFTNQQAALKGGIYLPTQHFPGDLTATATLMDPSLTNTITNLTGVKIVQATGAVSGAFPNPADPEKEVKYNGVILQGQTNAQGYFLGTNQSGAFILTPP